MAAVWQHEEQTVTTNDYRDRAAAAAESFRGDSRLHGIRLVIEQRITDAEHIVAQYHLRIGDGAVEVVDGPAAEPDVVMTQDRSTADSIRRGDAHAHRAFLTGRLRVDGDVDTLLEHGQLLTGLVEGRGSGDA